MTTKSVRHHTRKARLKPSAKERAEQRTALLHWLLEDIKWSSSLSQLYARMLIMTLLSEEEHLRQNFPKLARHLSLDTLN